MLGNHRRVSAKLMNAWFGDNIRPPVDQSRCDRGFRMEFTSVRHLVLHDADIRSCHAVALPRPTVISGAHEHLSRVFYGSLPCWRLHGNGRALTAGFLRAWKGMSGHHAGKTPVHNSVPCLAGCPMSGIRLKGSPPHFPGKALPGVPALTFPLGWGLPCSRLS